MKNKLQYTPLKNRSASTGWYERITQGYGGLGAMDDTLKHNNLKKTHRTSAYPLFTMRLILVDIFLTYQIIFIYNFHFYVMLGYCFIIYSYFNDYYECCMKNK